MATERKHVEFFVGLFLLIGFCFIAAMVVIFGRVGQSFNKYYEVTVEFPNASGLAKDSDVLLAGARIGFVAAAPKLVGRSYAVRVPLHIREDTKIPRKSSFLVGSSGLMGDRFVDVVPMPDFDPNEVAQPNELILGSRASGLDDLTAKGAVVMDQLIAELEEIKKMTASINQKVLHEDNLKSISETLSSLKATSERFSESSKKLDPIFLQAQAAVDSAKETMKTANAAAGDLRLAIGDVRKTAEGATQTVDAARLLVKKATQGEGALGTLISDKSTGENLKLFLSNLKRSGPLFYRDRPLPVTVKEQAAKPLRAR